MQCYKSARRIVARSFRLIATRCTSARARLRWSENLCNHKTLIVIGFDATFTRDATEGSGSTFVLSS